jgi:hypothetical protein
MTTVDATLRRFVFTVSRSCASKVKQPDEEVFSFAISKNYTKLLAENFWLA